MDFDLLNWFRSFDFSKYFDLTMHKMELKNTQWKKEAIMKDLSEGFRTIKCSICEKNSQWINLTKKECYCGEHIDFDVCSHDCIIKVDIIISEIKIKLELMDTYFIYIQERYNDFTDPNSDVKLNLRNKRVLNNIKQSLDTKIDAFHDRIKKLQKNKSLEYFFEVMESYDEIKLTIFEILKTISDLLHENKIDKLDKSIDEDLTITFQKDEKLKKESKKVTMEEPKEEIKEEQKKKKDFLNSLDIFDKEINIMVADYLSDKKIKQLHANFEKVCDCIDELQSQLKDCKEVNICISLVRHAFVPNLCPKNFMLKFYVIAKKFAYDFTNKYTFDW